KPAGVKSGAQVAKAAGPKSDASPPADASPSSNSSIVISPEAPVAIPVGPSPPETGPGDRLDPRPVSVLHRTNSLQRRLSSIGSEDDDAGPGRPSRTQTSLDAPDAAPSAPPASDLPRRPLDEAPRNSASTRRSESSAKAPTIEATRLTPEGMR